METIFQKISRVTGRKPKQCKCQKCKEQCKTPCLGTPDDILKLIHAGYKDKLQKSEWGVGLILGKIDYTIPMVQLKKTPTGCILFKDGLCEIHQSGLKPTEGKLSHHTITEENRKFCKNLSWNVAKEWSDIKNQETIKQIYTELT